MQAKSKSQLVVAGASFLLALIVAVIYQQTFELAVAVRGESVIGWAYHSVVDSLFSRDFPSILPLYDKTLTAHFFSIAYKYFHITPESFASVFVFLEILIEGTAAVVLLRTFFPSAGILVQILVFFVLIASNIRQMDFAQSYLPVFYGLYYSFADAFRIFAVASYFRHRFVWTGFWLALSFMCHPTMALYAAIFLFFCVAVNWREVVCQSTRSLAIAATVFLVLTGSWFLLTYDSSSVESGIPFQDWIQLAKISSYHWFPLTLGLFGERYYEITIPFLAFSFVYFYALLNISPVFARTLTWAYWGIVCVVAVGVVIAEYGHSPALIKLALQRSNDMILAIGAPLVVYMLWNDCMYGKWWKGPLAINLLLSPFLFRPGFPLLLSVALPVLGLFIFTKERTPNSSRKYLQLSVLALSVITVGFIFSLYAQGVNVVWQGQQFLGENVVLNRILLLAAIFVVLGLSFVPNSIRAIGVIVVVMWGGTISLQKVFESNPFLYYPKNIAADYKDVQLWARENTAVDSLFVPDPSIIYGWRDYSLRSSFGNPREWMFVGWNYKSDPQVYKEGLKRLAVFGMDLPQYLVEHKPQRYTAILDAVNEFFYRGDSEWLWDTAGKFQIDYFVVQKAKLIRAFDAPTAFENDSFIVYDTRKHINSPQNN